MLRRGILFAFLLSLEVAYSLPYEEKIEPVDLFYHCIEPEKDENEPDKSPVVLIHGFLATHKAYNGVDQLIAEKTKRKVCAVDLRNHGDSPWNNRTDVAAYAVDIGQFLDKQNIEKVNFIGESLGGKVAIHYTLNNPDRVDSLVAEDIRPNNVKTVAFATAKFFFNLLKTMIDSQPEGMNEKEVQDWIDQYVKDKFSKLPTESFPDKLSKFIDLHLIDGKWQPKHNMELLYESVSNAKKMWTESTGLYTGPVLFIYGTESVFQVGDDEEDILKLFPNAKLVPIEGAGHIIHEVHREFDDIVVKFLNEMH